MSNHDDRPQTEAGPSRPRGPTIDALFPPVFFSDPTRPPHPFDARPSYVDATCFSWCSQATHRRAEGWEPVCRMVCWQVDKDEGERIGAGVKPMRRASARAGADGATDDQDQGLRALRRRIRRWIDERELSFFKGSLEEMYYVQHERREVERMADRWEHERQLEKEKVVARTESDSAVGGDASHSTPPSSVWQHPPLPPDWAGKPILVDRDRASVERYRRRKRDDRDWAIDVREIGETGRLIDVPLSSLLIKPYYAFLHRLDVILSPSRSFVSAYVRSFGDGTQIKIAGMLWERASSGEVFDFAGKLGRKVVGAWMRPWPSRGSPDDDDNDDSSRPPRRPTTTSAGGEGRNDGGSDDARR